MDLRAVVEQHGVERPDAVREPLVEYFKSLGFAFVSLDLEGFRSGSLNALVSLENKRLFAPPPGS